MSQDKPNALTSASVPTPQPAGPTELQRRMHRLSPEAMAMLDDSIVAKPLSLAHEHRVIPKNTNLAFRWVNRAVGMSTPTLRYDQMTAAGFRPAGAADCSVEGLPLRDGHYIDGDVILMCIDRSQYIGALKYNAVAAMQRTDRQGVIDRGKSEVNKAIREVNAKPELRRKVEAFVPPSTEIEEKMPGSTEA